MDAPPPREDCRPFVRIAALLTSAGVNAPVVLAQDLDRGFLLLTDLGVTTYLRALDETERRGEDTRSVIFSEEELEAWLADPSLARAYFRRPAAPTGVVAWNDNEWGYACRLADITSFVASKIRTQRPAAAATA